MLNTVKTVLLIAVLSSISNASTEPITTDAPFTTKKPTPPPNKAKHIAEYCYHGTGYPTLNLQSTATLDSSSILSAWNKSDMWDFYAHPCHLNINAPSGHGIVLGIEFFTYEKMDLRSVLDTPPTCKKMLKINYNKDNEEKTTELCLSAISPAQRDNDARLSTDMTVHNYELLSSYDNNMKLYFYDNNKDDEDNQQYYLTFTAARRDSNCRAHEFQCIEKGRKSGVPHCIHKDLMCDGHVNCATVTEPFEEIYKNCGNRTVAVFHGEDLSSNPWFSSDALKYFLVIVFIITIFFFFVVCHFATRYATRHREDRNVRSRVSIVHIPTVRDGKAAEAASVGDLPPYEAAVEKPPAYKSLFLPLQINPPNTVPKSDGSST